MKKLSPRAVLGVVAAVAAVAAVLAAVVASISAHGSGGNRRSAQQSPAASTGPTAGPATDVGGPPSPTPEQSRVARRSPTPTASVAGGPAQAGLGAPVGDAVSCPSVTTTVRSAAELTAALAAAGPGTAIGLADGVYVGKFVATAVGTPAAPIWLCGGQGAVLDGGSTGAGYVLHLKAARYWRLAGFSVRNGQKGVVVDGSTAVVIQALTVSDIGDEAIHLRSATTYSVVRGNTISATGLNSEKFGEGIYVGTAKSNWCTYSACGPDRSNYNSIVANHISATSAESIDIKEGTQNGTILDNTFDGSRGLTGADSWVDVKGNNWLIAGNVGRNSPTDGFQVHRILSGWGNGNVFRNNTADVNGAGYGIHLTPIQDNVVSCDNKVTNAAAGLTNATCV